MLSKLSCTNHNSLTVSPDLCSTSDQTVHANLATIWGHVSAHTMTADLEEGRFYSLMYSVRWHSSVIQHLSDCDLVSYYTL